MCVSRGQLGANNDTLAALNSVGICIDSSYNPTHVECKLRLEQLNGFAPRLQRGILEVPLTVFQDGLNRPRPLQITAASFSEYRDLLWDARRIGYPCVVFCTHSMELIRTQRSPAQPERLVVHRFERLCQFLSENRSSFRTVTCSEIRDGFSVIKSGDNLLLPRPRTKRISTLRRIFGQAKRRVW